MPWKPVRSVIVCILAITIVFCSNPFIFVIKEYTNKAMNFIVVLML